MSLSVLPFCPGRIVPVESPTIVAGCPLILPEGVAVWLDASLKRFDTVFPACGSANSSIELNCDELAACSRAAGWRMSATTGNRGRNNAMPKGRVYPGPSDC